MFKYNKCEMYKNNYIFILLNLMKVYENIIFYSIILLKKYFQTINYEQ